MSLGICKRCGLEPAAICVKCAGEIPDHNAKLTQQMYKDKLRIQKTDEAMKLLGKRYRYLKNKQLEPADWLKACEKAGLCKLTTEPHKWIANKMMIYTLWVQYIKKSLGMKFKDLCAIFCIDAKYISRHTTLDTYPGFDLKTTEILDSFFNPKPIPDEQLVECQKLLEASSHALRSYQYGNGSADLAARLADRIDAALRPAEKLFPDSQGAGET